MQTNKQSTKKTGVITGVLLCSLLLLLVNAGSGRTADSLPDNNTIIAGVPADFPPHYSVENDRPRGFAIETMNKVADLSGLEVSYHIFPSWVDVHQAMLEGVIDVIPNMGITENRRGFAEFTRPLESFDLKFFIRTTAASIHSPADLQGRKIAVISTNAAIALLENRRDIELLVYNSLEEAFVALLSSNVDALAYPAPVVTHLAYEIGMEKRITALSPPLKEIKRAIAVSIARPELLKRLDAAVASFVASPEYLKIYRKWYGTPAPFWTVKKVATMMGALLLLCVMLILAWRYLSIRNLNARLLTLLQKHERTKDALQQSEKLYRELITGTDNIVTRVDGEGKLLFLNPKAAEIFGQPAEDCLGRPAFDFVHPGDRQRTTERFRNWLASQENVFTFKNRVKGMKGNVRTIFWTVNLHYDDNGELESINSIGTDLTALREKEQKLLEKDATIRTALHLSGTGVWSFDVKNRKTVWSDEIYLLLGYDSAKVEPSYRNWLARAHPDDRKELQLYFRNALPRLNDLYYEYRVLLPDGAIRWLRNVGWIKRGRNNEPLLMCGIEMDITEHKLSQQKLTASMDQVKMLLDSTAEGIYGVDLDGNCTFVNRACLQMLGYTEEKELIGKNMHNLVHHTRKNGSGYPVEECQIQQKPFLQGAGSHVDDDVMWRKDGSSFEAEYWSYPIVTSGRTVGAVVTFFDISERRKHEAELGNYREHLEKIVEERTSELKRIIKLMAGREIRMADLKRENRKLQEQVGSEADVRKNQTAAGIRTE